MPTNLSKKIETILLVQTKKIIMLLDVDLKENKNLPIEDLIESLKEYSADMLKSELLEVSGNFN